MELSRAKADRVFQRKHTAHSKHPLPTTQEKTLHKDITRWSTLNQIDYIICSQRWRSSIQSAKQDWELTVAQIMSSLLPNSDFFFFFSVTALFYLEDSRRTQDWKRRDWRSAWGGRKRERKRDRESARACTRKRESQRKRFGSFFYMFFPPPGPALCKLGLARSAVCPVCSA